MHKLIPPPLRLIGFSCFYKQFKIQLNSSPPDQVYFFLSPSKMFRSLKMSEDYSGDLRGFIGDLLNFSSLSRFAFRVHAVIAWRDIIKHIIKRTPSDYAQTTQELNKRRKQKSLSSSLSFLPPVVPLTSALSEKNIVIYSSKLMSFYLYLSELNCSSCQKPS